MRTQALLGVSLIAFLGISGFATANPEISVAITRPAADRALALALKPHETPARLLKRAGVPADQARQILAALYRAAPKRVFSAGDVFSLTLSRDFGDGASLVSLHVENGVKGDITLFAQDDAAPGNASRARRSVRGTAGGNLSVVLADIGLPPTVVDGVRTALAHDPDVSGGFDSRTRFALVYEMPRDDDDGDPALSHLTLSSPDGREHQLISYPAFRMPSVFAAAEGTPAPDLSRMTQDLPISGGKLTSPWGWRMHPVLKRPQFHKGVDFSAPAGTPVHATADGMVAFEGRHGNYGRMIRLHHGSGAETVYAHLQGFAGGVKSGAHVHRGQVIGYVGRSGLATGNHLYYEVLADGHHLDPLGAEALRLLHSAAADGTTARKLVFKK